LVTSDHEAIDGLHARARLSPPGGAHRHLTRHRASAEDGSLRSGQAARQQRRASWLAAAAFLLPIAIASSVASAATPAPKLSWQPCANPAPKGFQCATATVPRSYRQPHRAKIHLAVIRHRATDPARRIGTLFFNPGGPGGKGTTGLPLELGAFPAALRERFDLVSWDPRGVGDSTAVQCFDSQEDENRYFAGVPDGFPVGSAEMDKWIERYGAFGRRCGRVDGKLLRHVSTADTARDLNLLRRASVERVSVASRTASRPIAHSPLVAAKAYVRRIRLTTRVAGICATTMKSAPRR
jgi:hypothetical protein